LNANGFLNNLLGGEEDEDCLKSSNPIKFWTPFLFWVVGWIRVLINRLSFTMSFILRKFKIENRESALDDDLLLEDRVLYFFLQNCLVRPFVYLHSFFDLQGFGGTPLHLDVLTRWRYICRFSLVVGIIYT
jgi:hypothetical protein